jgi:ferritin-like metal-binding protein YciE
VAELDGVWDVERTGGFLPPLIGMRKRISGERGATTVGPARASFRVVGREIHYEAPFTGFVDVVEPDGDGFNGRALYQGREYGRFRLRRSTVADLQSQLVKHLDEAYAMEQNVLRMLDGMIKTTDDPTMLDALEHHRAETQGHAELMRGRLEAHGATPSAVREVGGIVGALVKLPLDLVRGDKAGRNARDAFATEHMEIASYELLERIARRTGDEETVQACQQIKAQEQAMAQRIAETWDLVVEQSLREEGIPA